MSVTYNRRGELPRDLWPRQATALVAQRLLGKVQTRVFERSRDVDDKPFKAYSTTGPLYILLRDFPRPRGGVRSRTGRSMRFKSYRDYKLRTLGTARVNLTKSGGLRRSYRVKRLSRDGFTMGPTGDAAVYGEGLQRQGRRWQGLSPSDREFLGRVVADAVHRVITGEIGPRRRGPAPEGGSQ